ncbi:hypothetical protein [Bradyrhizobium sp. HKCCYLS3013]|uniref:hypothetical protein n=1 Tax=Bradyrhizobium sp. HKCCYLS3013 TaxID=3420735 RepID=UPI003EBF7CF9
MQREIPVVRIDRQVMLGVVTTEDLAMPTFRCDAAGAIDYLKRLPGITDARLIEWTDSCFGWAPAEAAEKVRDD